jgi:hypothetical protein
LTVFQPSHNRGSAVGEFRVQQMAGGGNNGVNVHGRLSSPFHSELVDSRTFSRVQMFAALSRRHGAYLWVKHCTIEHPNAPPHQKASARCHSNPNVNIINIRLAFPFRPGLIPSPASAPSSRPVSHARTHASARAAADAPCMRPERLLCLAASESFLRDRFLYN